MEIVVAHTAEDRLIAASLMKEYFHSWGLEDLSTEPELLTELDGLLDYQPPDGCVLYATLDRPVAVVALKRVDPKTCEMKRMFVRPDARRRGVGRALVTALMARAVDMGYTRMRLDTPADNGPALNMYRAFGFSEIESYLDPNHGHVHDNWTWLAADLLT
jgi:ribosomal protein S18 acetylase RimI-like enzyme